MKFSRITNLALTLFIPMVSHASTIFTLSTGITGADTKINSSAESDWYASSFTPNCQAGAGNCTGFAVAVFDNVSVSYDLGGGLFDIKESSNNTSTITFDLWDGNVGGTLASPTGATLVATATIAAGTVGSSYTPTAFTFSTPFTLQVGHSYVATLTSTAPSNAGWFVKTPNSAPYYTVQDPNGDNPPTGSSAPEPSTSTLMGGALLLVAGALKRVRRRA